MLLFSCGLMSNADLEDCDAILILCEVGCGLMSNADLED